MRLIEQYLIFSIFRMFWGFLLLSVRGGSTIGIAGILVFFDENSSTSSLSYTLLRSIAPQNLLVL